MDKNKKKASILSRRKRRVRKKVLGTGERPRLSVRRSLKQIYVQAIDDTRGRSIVNVSSLSKDLKEKKEGTKGKLNVSKAIGGLAAEKLAEKGIKKVVFDKGGYPYHGRIKAVAEGAREKGLQF